MAALLLVPTMASAHSGAHPPTEMVEPVKDTHRDGASAYADCHGGVFCTLTMILDTADGAALGCPGLAGTGVIADSDLANLFARSFDPPPPRVLS